MSLFPRFKIKADTPAKVAKVAKVALKFSNFSNFSSPANSDLETSPALEIPAIPCACGARHYWLSPSGWRCSACSPMSEGFAGETLTVSGPVLSAVTNITRETLERIHPATIQGIPLSVVLDHADPSDYPDLVDTTLLEAFTASLIATETLDPTQCREALKQALPRPKRPMARCCDCRHFIPSPTDPRHGVGGCRVDSPAQMHPDVWPATERVCGEFEAKEGQP